MQIDFETFYPVYATARDCTPNSAAACNPQLVILKNGKEEFRLKGMSGSANLHTNHISGYFKFTEIPNDSRITVQVWNMVESGTSELMSEWAIPPSEFNIGGNLLIGQEYSRKILGKDQRTELYLHFNWLSKSNLGRRLAVFKK